MQAERIDEVTGSRCVEARASTGDHAHSTTRDRQGKTGGRKKKNRGENIGEHREQKQAILAMVTILLSQIILGKWSILSLTF